MTERLKKFHWSPRPPEAYTVPHKDTKRPCGIGVIAGQNYAAFNLVWASSKADWSTFNGHVELCKEFTALKPLTQTKINNVLLFDYLTLFSQANFMRWLHSADGIPPKVKRELTNLLTEESV